jgi:hypothetical protein
MRRLLTIAVMLSLAATAAGCGSANKQLAGLTGFTRICIDGVAYLQFSSGASVEYTPAGKIKTCG